MLTIKKRGEIKLEADNHDSVFVCRNCRTSGKFTDENSPFIRGNHTSGTNPFCKICETEDEIENLYDKDEVLISQTESAVVEDVRLRLIQKSQYLEDGLKTKEANQDVWGIEILKHKIELIEELLGALK